MEDDSFMLRDIIAFVRQQTMLQLSSERHTWALEISLLTDLVYHLATSERI
jgi:hypothetical protein